MRLEVKSFLRNFIVTGVCSISAVGMSASPLARVSRAIVKTARVSTTKASARAAAASGAAHATARPLVIPQARGARFDTHALKGAALSRTVRGMNATDSITKRQTQKLKKKTVIKPTPKR